MASTSGTLRQAEAIPVAGTLSAVKARTRMLAIDALRGFVMICMLVDHVRETFYLHRQISDPMDPMSTPPELFFTRMVSEICAPAFIFLTGLSAYLYGQSHSMKETSVFLFKRGLFLIVLELTVVSFAWTAEFPPSTLWLQVIWCIGICMLALAVLLHLPRRWIVIIGVAIVTLHNLTDGILIGPDSPLFVPWSILHQRVFIDLGGVTRARTTYPVLPWIGVIMLGYAIGPWFAKDVDSPTRIKRLLQTGGGLILAFLVIRYLNFYGEKPWVHTGQSLQTFMSFLCARKYPPSLMFLMPTIGLSILLMAFFEKIEKSKATATFAVLGGAPMFFYILHLYVLKIMYLIALAVWGPNYGQFYGFDGLAGIWMWWLILAVMLYFPAAWFARLKQRRRDLTWLKYF